MADTAQSVQDVSLETGQVSEQIAEQIITAGHEEQVNMEMASRTEQMLRRLISGDYTFESVTGAVRGLDSAKEIKICLYRLWGREIIRLLNEDVAKQRMMSSRQRYSSVNKARQEASGNNKGRKKNTSVQDNGDDAGEESSVQKMTLDEIGQELSKQEEQDKEKRAEFEQLEKEVQTERARVAKAYQFAFEFFGLAIEMAGEEDSSRLVDLVKKLGNENFGVRQSAIDNLLNEQNIVLAVDALEAALKDKIIVHKAIQGVAKTGEFHSVETLLDIIRENAGAKESTVRGLAEQAVGEILLAMNRKKKGSGLKRLYVLLKNPKNEKQLSSLIGILSRDIESIQMRKFYINKQCLKWLFLIGTKLVNQKKKKVKVTFVTVAVNTPLTKEINVMLKEIKNLLGAA